MCIQNEIAAEYDCQLYSINTEGIICTGYYKQLMKLYKTLFKKKKI